MTNSYAKLMALIAVILVSVVATTSFQKTVTVSTPGQDTIASRAPIATSGDNIYITWSTNKTGTNDEVMFRASTDVGKTFGDKINLSNSTKADSQDVQLDTSGDRVFVTWWERNATSNEPVMRVSNNNDKTFGEILKLASNGTIGGG